MSSNPFNQPPQSEGPSSQPSASGWGSQPTDQPFTPQPGVETPKIDIFDNSSEIWVVANVPGFTEDELRLSGDETTLVLAADRIDNVEEGRHVVVQERPRQIQRMIPLPAPVDITEARASYEDGVCKVILPKTAAQRYEDIPFRHE